MPVRTPSFDLVANQATEFDIDFAQFTERLRLSDISFTLSPGIIQERARYVELVQERRRQGHNISVFNITIGPTLENFANAFNVFTNVQRTNANFIAATNTSRYRDSRGQNIDQARNISDQTQNFSNYLRNKVDAHYRVSLQDSTRMWNLITSMIEDSRRFQSSPLILDSMTNVGLFEQSGQRYTRDLLWGLNPDSSTMTGNEKVIKFKLIPYNFNSSTSENATVRTVENIFGCKFNSFPGIVKTLNKMFADFMPRGSGSRNGYPAKIFYKKMTSGTQEYYQVWIANSKYLRGAVMGPQVGDQWRHMGISVVPGSPNLFWPTRSGDLRRVSFRSSTTNHSVTSSNADLMNTAQRIRSLPTPETEEDRRIRQQIRAAVSAEGTFIPGLAPQRVATYDPSRDINLFIRTNMNHIGSSVLVTDQNRTEFLRIAQIFNSGDPYTFNAHPGVEGTRRETFQRNIRPLVNEFIKVAWKIHSQNGERNFGGSDHWSQVPGFPCMVASDLYPHPQADSTMPRNAFRCQFKMKRSHMERLFGVGEMGPRRDRSNLKNEIHQVLRKVNEIAALLGFKVSTKMVRPIAAHGRVLRRPNDDQELVVLPNGQTAPVSSEPIAKQRIFIIENMLVPTYLNQETHFLGRIAPVDNSRRQVPSFFLGLENVRNELLTFLGNPVVEPVVTQPSTPPVRPVSAPSDSYVRF